MKKNGKNEKKKAVEGERKQKEEQYENKREKKGKI